MNFFAVSEIDLFHTLIEVMNILKMIIVLSNTVQAILESSDEARDFVFLNDVFWRCL